MSANVFLLRACRALLAGALCLNAVSAAGAPQELHGHSDAIAANGVMIAWGVLRGATEEATAIVLRIVADPALFARVAVDGVDPFTQRRQVVIAERPATGLVDVRTPRAHFADFPRTELRFYPVAAAATAAPSLVVFYLGVPDTTPEFANEASLDAYLADRIARLAAGRNRAP